MVTGASTADLALILVDARKGVVEQTRRHTAITALLGIRHLVLCVNKMDLVYWSRERFEEIECDYRALAAQLGVEQVSVLPMAAAPGANIVDRAPELAWFAGPTLLEFLETADVAGRARHEAFRLPVQYVIRPQSDEFHDYRGYAGTISAGRIRRGDEVVVLPIGVRSRVAGIDRFEESAECAEGGDAVAIRLAEDIDVSRGYMLAAADNAPAVANRFQADICWMSDERQLRPRQQLWLKHTTRRVKCLVESLDDRLDIASLERVPAPEAFALNECG
jgi:bifunctional enzyme CysN/CysC